MPEQKWQRQRQVGLRLLTSVTACTVTELSGLTDSQASVIQQESAPGLQQHWL